MKPGQEFYPLKSLRSNQKYGVLLKKPRNLGKFARIFTPHSNGHLSPVHEGYIARSIARLRSTLSDRHYRPEISPLANTFKDSREFSSRRSTSTPLKDPKDERIEAGERCTSLLGDSAPTSTYSRKDPNDSHNEDCDLQTSSAEGAIVATTSLFLAMPKEVPSKRKSPSKRPGPLALDDTISSLLTSYRLNKFAALIGVSRAARWYNVFWATPKYLGSSAKLTSEFASFVNTRRLPISFIIKRGRSSNCPTQFTVPHVPHESIKLWKLHCGGKSNLGCPTRLIVHDRKAIHISSHGQRTNTAKSLSIVSGVVCFFGRGR